MKALEFRPASVDDLPWIVQMKLAMFREAGHDGLLAPNAGDLVLEDYRSMYASGIAHTLSLVVEQRWRWPVRF